MRCAAIWSTAYERFPSGRMLPIFSCRFTSGRTTSNCACSYYMTLGTPQDVTLQELRIETFFPADEASERIWHERFASFLSPAFSQHST